MADQHLRAEADAEQRRVLGQRHLPASRSRRRMKSSPSLALIGPPEHDGARMIGERLRQRIAEAVAG